MKVTRILGICGSPRPQNISMTYKAMVEYIWELTDRSNTSGLGGTESAIVSIPAHMEGCIGCQEPDDAFMRCVPDPPQYILGERQCSLLNNNYFIYDTIQKIINADIVIIGSPVYLDHPTSQLMAFLSRLTCWVESTNREYLVNKQCHIIATGFCSGTKTTIGTLFNMVEMLGFTIPGRSSREYILKWDDKKLRGGRKGEEIFIK